MTVLVGYPPNHQATDALHLGAALARSTGENLVVCAVAPAPWIPSKSQVDAEYLESILQMSRQALDQAREDLPGDVAATFLTVRARSAASGLLQVAEEQGASVLVLGSSTAGMFGHITMSSVAARLLHSSPVPIAQAARGFRCPEDETITRITVAYGGSRQDEALVGAMRLAATRTGVKLRLAAFAVQLPPPVNARFTSETRDIVRVWSEEMRTAARKTLGENDVDVDVDIDDPGQLEPVIGFGSNWADAVDSVGWESGEVLVVGSGSAGPFARVFLGSRAAKLIRTSPVPVIVVPRAAAKRATDRRDQGGQK